MIPEDILKFDPDLFRVFEPDLVWEQYLVYEEEFLHYLRYVPLDSAHYIVYSIRLADLLINIGSTIDSFLNNAIYCDCLDEIPDIKKYREIKKRNMNHHKIIFENFYNLSSKEIFELKNYSEIAPFFNWREDEKSIEWWSDYNDIKHDRFLNRRKATLKTTLDALGALFLLNVIHIDTMAILVRDGIIRSVYDKPSLVRILSKKEPIDASQTIYAKTHLFGYVFDQKSFERSLNDKIGILSPYNPGY